MAGTIQSHRDLIVWQKAMDLVVIVYPLARHLPRDEQFGLKSQMTRAAVSVPANIAEGHAQGSAKDYAQFIAIAKGSLMELETHLMLCIRLRYFTQSESAAAMDLIGQISRMLTALHRNLLK